MYLRVRTFILISALFIVSNIFPQTINKIKTDQSKKTVMVKQQPGHLYQTFTKNDSTFVIDNDMTKQLDVIVEFKDPPMFVQAKAKGLAKMSPAQYSVKQAQLSSDIMTLHEKAQKIYNTNLIAPYKKCEFHKLFNGASLTISRAILADIASLDYVKRVYIDKKVTANLKESVHIIGADSVWAKYGDEGDSVIVGIIDTGIDYMHPALGGGFGKGYKVIGGYDFVNNDADPMDDAGHGTHVAGIVAGNNSVIKGVAPKALLMAFKVLGSNGNGTETNVIKGIERAVDPNDDNDYSDKVDVANMSLGGYGNSEDPISTAVNNAVSLGVTFCIAAGNSWEYQTIGSPGTAEQAITVGATDKSDELAYFSSKGPSRGCYSIKPEVLAPGVDITSSVLNSGYASYSGTSMASPHVAGVCALLKHMHKDWTPQMIKSAIMTSAKNLGLDVMAQGSGRVDAFKAISVSTFAIPAKVSFGLDTVIQNVWNKVDTIEIINKYTSVQNYNVKISGLKTGIDIASSDNSFSLQPGEVKKILFALTANNSNLSGTEPISNAFGGNIQISGSKDTLLLPWAFVKLSRLVLSFDKPVNFCIVFSKDNTYVVNNNTEDGDLYRYEMVIRNGLYNIWSNFMTVAEVNGGNGEISFVMIDSVEVNKYATRNINSTDAVNNIKFNGVDETGNLVREQKNSKNYIFLAHNYDGYQIGNSFIIPPSDNVKFSNLSSAYKIKTTQFQNDINTGYKVRLIQYPLFSGLNADVNLTNLKEKLIKQNIKITLSSFNGTTDAYFVPFIFDTAGSSYMTYISGESIQTPTWTGELYISPETEKEYEISAAVICYDSTKSNVTLETGYMRYHNDSVAVCSNMFSTNPIYDYVSPNNGTLTFGDGAIAPCFTMIVTDDGLQNYANFTGQLNEQRIYDNQMSIYSIYDNANNLLKTDTLYKVPIMKLSTGLYHCVINNNYYTVNGIRGKGTLKLDFIPKTDATYELPPNLDLIRIYNSKNATCSKLEKGESSRIIIKFSKVNLDLTKNKVLVKNSNSQTWIELKAIVDNTDRLVSVLTADLSEITKTDPAKFDVKIQFVSNQGLNHEWVLEPAFVVGDYIDAVKTDSTKSDAMPKKFALYANYPNPFNPSTIISYDLPKQAVVELKIYDILGKEVATLVNKELAAGSHSVEFDASRLGSGVYFYTIKAGGYFAVKKMLLLK
jgi:hypothetical protein